MLLDSSIIIYASQPEHGELRRLIAERAPKVSVVSKIEALGYHSLAPAERLFLEAFFDAAVVMPVTDAVAGQAIALRQQRRMSLGDSLIAATALVHGLTLVTRNVSDFDRVAGLAIVDPLSESGAQ